METEVPFEEVRGYANRPILLPRLATLGVIGAITLILARWHWTWGTGLVFMLVYLSALLLRTRDLLTVPDNLSPWDRRLCQFSGPLAALLFVVLVAVFVMMIAPYDHQSQSPVLQAPWVILLQFSLEAGVVLSMTCLSATKSLGHIWPLLFWKLLSGVLLFIHSCYTLVMLFLPFAKNMD